MSSVAISLLGSLFILSSINLSDQPHISLTVLNMDTLRPALEPSISSGCLSKLMVSGSNCNNTISNQWVKSDIADRVRDSINKGDTVNAQKHLNNLVCCAGYEGVTCLNKETQSESQCNSNDKTFMNSMITEAIKEIEKTDLCSPYKHQSEQCKANFDGSGDGSGDGNGDGDGGGSGKSKLIPNGLISTVFIICWVFYFLKSK